MSSSFKLLIDLLWPDDEDGKEGNFSPIELFQKISEMSPLFKNDQSQNPKNFINFIIMTLHGELNQNNNNNENIEINNSNNNIFNLFSSYNAFLIEYKKKFNSKISELFYGIKGIQNQCLNCGIYHYNYQPYFFLSFSLKEVINSKKNDKKIKKNPKKLDKLNNNIIDMLDCFIYYYHKTIILQGDNKIYCNNCNKETNSSHNTFLATTPKILIIILEREQEEQSEIKLEFSLDLDISKLIKIGQLNDERIEYKLIGIVDYHKENKDKKNYVAHCINPIDKQWYTYYDTNINQIDNIQKQVIDFGNPYLLFYEKK